MSIKNFKKKLFPFAVVSAIAFTSVAGAVPNAEANGNEQPNGKVKNVIFLIGDGDGSRVDNGIPLFAG